jgi:hypothetical protein
MLKMQVADFLLKRSKPFFKRAAPVPPPTIPGQHEITEKEIRYIIEQGIQAPSGDNGQPWKFSYRDNIIELYLNKEADRSFFNFRQIASIISCGAVLENMRLAAL